MQERKKAILHWKEDKKSLRALWAVFFGNSLEQIEAYFPRFFRLYPTVATEYESRMINVNDPIGCPQLN